MPAIDISKLARLDERDARDAPARAEETSHPATAAAFAPPGEDGDGDALGVERSTRAIRIESEWLRERAAKQAAAALPPPKPRLRIRGVLTACAAIVVVVTAVVLVMRFQRAPAPAPPPTVQRGGDSVSIRITAHDPTEVMIDGHRAGKTPLTLQQPRGAKPIEITAPKVVRQIVPDHDQVVDLSAP